MEKMTLAVAGMACEHCVKAVQSALGDLPGVGAVAVDLKKGEVTCTVDTAKSTRQDIEAAIVDAGYELPG